MLKLHTSTVGAKVSNKRVPLPLQSFSFVPHACSPRVAPKPRHPTCQQVQLLQSLDHCNIIRYVDFFLEGGREDVSKLVIVFEW